MNLNKYERETSILWNQSEDPVSIWTYDSKLKKRLRKFARKHPNLCRIEKDTKGFVVAEVEKSRVSVHLNSPQSKERREMSGKRGKMSPLFRETDKSDSQERKYKQQVE